MIVGGALHHTGLCVYFFSFLFKFRFSFHLISIFKFLGVPQGRPGEFFSFEFLFIFFFLYNYRLINIIG